MSLTVRERLAELVAINSVNASLENGAGEAELAGYVGDAARALGADVELHEVLPGRPNVLAWIRRGGRPTLMLECHLDTVALAPMPDALRPRVADGRMHGRGSADPKGCLAAMLAVLEAAAADQDFPVDLCLVGAADEEIVMRGSRALAGMDLAVEAVVVGEPTQLRIVVAHKGAVRWRLRTRGVAAHSATPELGHNAIFDMGPVIATLRGSIEPGLGEASHPLLGSPTWSVGTIRGGMSVNVVPDICEVECERRTLPGEDSAAILAKVDRALDRLRAENPDIRLERDDPFVDLPAIETPPEAPIVRAAREALAEAGRPTEVIGVAYATDAANLVGIGHIPAVVLGPGNIAQAHTDNEWIDLTELEAAVPIYMDLCRVFGGQKAARG
jgi:acetylornithine deacetylase